MLKDLLRYREMDQTKTDEPVTDANLIAPPPRPQMPEMMLNSSSTVSDAFLNGSKSDLKGEKMNSAMLSYKKCDVQ
ncbi:hypothetical protein E5288_WYG015917 [Bos mutus]|uniref:Uncharacterized protein n=1 Tax=Bos mutus TaxID=72004 RepID=A0A6B0RPI0_9CETA|nr:hypothetical protein [Bos mutus]